MGNKVFPRDCTKECPHFNCYDLSIDDYVYQCRKLNIEVDIGWSLFTCLCPLDGKEKN